jgi:hypothetical protein
MVIWRVSGVRVALRLWAADEYLVCDHQDVQSGENSLSNDCSSVEPDSARKGAFLYWVETLGMILGFPGKECLPSRVFAHVNRQ